MSTGTIAPGTVGQGTGLDETLDHDKDSGDEHAHYVRVLALVAGGPVEALCGKKWTPGKSPEGLPVCPTCKDLVELAEQMEGP